MNKRVFMVILIFVLIFTIIGCSQANPNDNISPKAVNVSDLLSNPDLYNGQMVTVAGEIVYVCPTNGWFFNLKDGSSTIKIDLKETNVRAYQQQIGASVKAYGEFISAESEPYIKADEIELWYS